MNVQGDIGREQADDAKESTLPGGGGEDESSTESEGEDDHLHDDQKAPGL